MSKTIEQCGGYAFPCEAIKSKKEYVTISDPEATAFGEQVEHVKRETVKFSGMTLRDYFAAAALQGICARAFPEDTVWERPFVEYAAPFAYEMADAMIKARGEIET